MMIAVIYVSRATHAFSALELLALLRKSRANNTRDGITGLLLYHNGEFMQGVEGDEAAVTRLLDRVARDPRHTDMNILMREPIAERQFPGWAMAFEHVDELKPEQRAALGELLEIPLSSDQFKQEPHRAWTLMAAFKGSLK